MTWAGALRRAGLGCLLAATVACTPLIRNHGYVPSDEDLAGVLVGVDTRDTVADVIGTPSAGGVLNDGGYYYVSKQFSTFAYQEPKITDRQVVAITFDGEGVVKNVERFTLEDGNVVALSRRVTDSNIQGVSFLRQLLGSIGNFNADTLLGG
ncbi:outer membrane protein assembly factor BamE [Alphaproteobacteria bacterium KMM 3653]|uniref:Outer membrane protein assembly factor BamE n=1 Tax=Harenicola maris TaxID=2841044 RepID=A0AAP2CR19_9RHOB|nr:outer membrane protein assembly factor BamE [Harenicola maris]